MMNKKRRRILIPKKAKIAFVCSGGAAKAGAFHIGVALALQEKGFKFVGGLVHEDDDDESTGPVRMVNKTGREISIYVGSSAGSIICSYLAAGYSIDQIFDSFLGKPHTGPAKRSLKSLSYYNLFSMKKEAGWVNTFATLTEGIKTPVLKKFMQGVVKDSYETLFQLRWLKWSGLFSTSGIEKYLREDVLPSNNFSNYKADLFIVGTQLNHSKKVIFGKYDFPAAGDDRSCLYVNDTSISDAAAASTALPPIFAPWPITRGGGKKIYYFDGEIRDTLSTHVAFDAGADLVIASYSHQPYHYKKEIGSIHEYGVPSILIQALYLMIERKIQQHRQFQDRKTMLYDSIGEYCVTHNITEIHKKQLLELVEQKLSFKRDTHHIYIHPKPGDHEMFFGDHFNLNSKKLKEMVRIGFRSAIDVLRRYEFE